MYSKENIKIERVIYEDQFEKFHELFKECDKSMSAFCVDSSKDSIRTVISRQTNIFFNVYYEKCIIGYILLELRSKRTADFHWGLVAKNKYLPKIIEDVFDHCCKMEIDNFIGWTPSSNRIALKIANKMGFEVLSEIPNYYDDNKAATLTIYKNKRVSHG